MPQLHNTPPRRTFARVIGFHGEFGVEAQVLRERELFGAHTFQTRALAVQWPEEEWKAIV